MRAEKFYYPLMVNSFLNTTSVTAWMVVTVSSHPEFRNWLSKSPRNNFTLKQISHFGLLSVRKCLSSVKIVESNNSVQIIFYRGDGVNEIVLI